MPANRRPVVRRWAVFAVIILGHLCVLVFWARGHSLQRRERSDVGTAMELLLLPLPDRPKPSPSNPVFPRALPSRTPRTKVSPAPPDTDAIKPDPVTPSVDWAREAEITARSHVEELARSNVCDDTGRPDPSVPKCKKPSRPFQWDPEPPKAGIEGFIPYVRLGKHCVVALGLFGCAVGKLPEANGHLFDDLKDPDRPRSSVPEVLPRSP